MKAKLTQSAAKGAQLSLRVKPTKSADATAGLAMVPACLQLKEILVPIDFSDSSEKALKYAAKFAEQFGSNVTLLHVIQPIVYPAEFGYPATIADNFDDVVREQTERQLQDLARQVSASSKCAVRVGQPYHEITTAARELGIDLIIIATHGRTGLKHVLMGSTAERVVRHAPCPVLTLREREHDFV